MTTSRVSWVLVTRQHRGRFFRPVAGVPDGLTWNQASDLGTQLAGQLYGAGVRDVEVWNVPSQRDQQYSVPEDRDTVLTQGMGRWYARRARRVPIRWDASPAYTVEGVQGDRSR